MQVLDRRHGDVFAGGSERVHAALHRYLTRHFHLSNMHIYIKVGHFLARWDIPEHSHKPCDFAGQLAVSRVHILSDSIALGARPSMGIRWKEHRPRRAPHQVDWIFV